MEEVGSVYVRYGVMWRKDSFGYWGWGDLSDLGYEESSRFFYMGPESLFKEDFDTLPIGSSDRVEYSFIFKLIERTSRVNEYPTGLEGVNPGMEELGLESGDPMNIFNIPIFESFFCLESDPFARAGGIEEYSIKSIRE